MTAKQGKAIIPGGRSQAISPVQENHGLLGWSFFAATSTKSETAQ